MAAREVGLRCQLFVWRAVAVGIQLGGIDGAVESHVHEITPFTNCDARRNPRFLEEIIGFLEGPPKLVMRAVLVQRHLLVRHTEGKSMHLERFLAANESLPC